jgi:hypothetical protein
VPSFSLAFTTLKEKQFGHCAAFMVCTPERLSRKESTFGCVTKALMQEDAGAFPQLSGNAE